MADLFISYSREDKERAAQVARGMEAAGFDVFWDTEIPPGQTWADFIEQKLTSCAAVIVLWSQHSTKSQWVREEARMGRERGKLIPASLDDSAPPFGFGEVQAADISTWRGQQDAPEWVRLVGAVRAAVERARGGAEPPPIRPFTAGPPPAQPPPQAPPIQSAHSSAPPAKKGVHPGLIIGGLVAAAVVLLGVVGATMGGSQTTQPVQSVASNVPPQAGGGDYGAQIDARLNQVAQMLGSQGYMQDGQPFRGQLNVGQVQSVPAQLQGGVEYRVVGVCDNDCGDLDLQLRDANGNVLVQDNATDPMPVLTVPAHAGGSYSVDVRMYACTQQPCYFAVVLYGRAG